MEVCWFGGCLELARLGPRGDLQSLLQQEQEEEEEEEEVLEELRCPAERSHLDHLLSFGFRNFTFKARPQY